MSDQSELYQKATKAYAEIAKAIHNAVDGELLELHRKADEVEAKLAELAKRSDEWEQSHREADEEDDDGIDLGQVRDDEEDEEDHLDTMPEGFSVSYEARDPRETMNLAFKDLFVAHRRQRRSV